MLRIVGNCITYLMCLQYIWTEHCVGKELSPKGYYFRELIRIYI